MTIQPLAQWRWDHERDSVLADDNAERLASVEQRRGAEQQRKQYLDRVTLNDLLNHRFFAKWDGYPSSRGIHASRRIMEQTVRELLNLGTDPSERDRMAVLQRCIESFNELDAQLHFIETVEREDICEEFEALVHACGLGRYQHLADEWRDW